MRHTRLLVLIFTVILSPLIKGKTEDSNSLFPPAKDFAIETIATDLSNPMEMSIAGDLVFIAELHGNIKVVDLTTGVTRVVAHLEVDYRKKGPKWSWDVESGVLGIAVAPDFEKTNWVYICYTRPGGESVKHDHVVSRFRYEDGMLNEATEQVIIKIPALRDKDRIHEAGSLAFGPKGNLFISSGDNQDHTQFHYAARTSTNSAVLNGKILRIHPRENGGYTIPDGTLFPIGTPKTRPEIYVMGCRNPFRISIDQRTSHLYWGENGPADHYCGSLQNVDKKLLPLGFDEFNQARKPGYFGWPFFIGPNESYPDYSFEKKEVMGVFDPSKAINHFKENTGIEELPPTQKPLIWYSHPPSKDFPSLGSGGASAVGGPVYYHNDSRSNEGLPKSFNHHWFIADYARGWVKMVELDNNENLVEIKDFPTSHRFQTPTNIKFNEAGQLFVLQYGRGGWDPDNGGSLVRISHRIDGGLAGNQMIAARPLRGLPPKHPGTALMGRFNCVACHQPGGTLIGPSLEMIVDRYADLPTRKTYLKGQIKKGSKGIWGEVHAMPPHDFLKDEQVEEIVDALFQLKLINHEARNLPPILASPPSPNYPGTGPAELVDGITGDPENLKSDWLGFEGEDLVATIDFGKTISVEELGLSSCQVTSAGVFLPPTVEFSVSLNGKDFKSVATTTTEVPKKKSVDTRILSTKIKEVKARHLRVHAKNLGTIPDWHQAKGRKAWLFIDEILVNPQRSRKNHR